MKRQEKKPVYSVNIGITPSYAVSYVREITGCFQRRKSNPPDAELRKMYKEIKRKIENSELLDTAEQLIYNSLDKSKFTTMDISKKASKKIKIIFQWLIACSNVKQVYSIKEKKAFWFKINFITLTLSSPQKHSDNFIKSTMLEQFLQWCKRSHGVNSYMWKAEAQKNGNIHFHITTNKFIHWKEVRQRWNRIQDNYGYFKGNSNPEYIADTNSTDIKAVKSERSIVNYMMKYFTKSEEGKRKIEGKLWSASNNLLKTSLVVDDMDIGFTDCTMFIESLRDGADIKKDFCTITPLKYYSYKQMPKLLHERYLQAVAAINAKDTVIKKYTVETFY